MSRHLRRTPNSRRFQRVLCSAVPFRLQNFRPKSLFRHILPISHLDGIFCGELFLIALCFQYFAEARGVGGGAVVETRGLILRALIYVELGQPIACLSPSRQRDGHQQSKSGILGAHGANRRRGRKGKRSWSRGATVSALRIRISLPNYPVVLVSSRRNSVSGSSTAHFRIRLWPSLPITRRGY